MRAKVKASSFEPVLQTTAWPHYIFGQVLSSHSIFSSFRIVRPCSPSGSQWIGYWRTTWSTACSSAPHSQAAEEAIPHLYKHERKCPTPVRRRLSRTHAILGRVIRGGVPGMKMRGLVGLSAHSAFYWWSAQCAARMLLSDQGRIQPVTLGGDFSNIWQSSHYGLTTVKEMKRTSQHCCGKRMDGKMAFISRVLFSELYKIMVKKVILLYVLRGLSPHSPPWIRPCVR